MQAIANPATFPAPLGFNVEVLGGTSPYQFTPMPSPPNPPGVTVNPGPPAHVSVSPSPEPGTLVRVVVTDSSDPQQTATAVATVM